MNGVASASMRQTDDYRVNFGVELARLEYLANEVTENLPAQDRHSLAQTLWKEAVRECRILATMIQPHETFDEEFCDIWMENIHTAEIGQIACLYLFQNLPYISEKALTWIAEESELKQICGYTIFVHHPHYIFHAVSRPFFSQCRRLPPHLCRTLRRNLRQTTATHPRRTNRRVHPDLHHPHVQ